MENLKSLPYIQRKKMFRAKLIELCHTLDIDIMPILTQTPGALVAQILFIDMQDEALMRRLGIVRTDPLSRVSDDGEKSIN